MWAQGIYTEIYQIRVGTNIVINQKHQTVDALLFQQLSVDFFFFFFLQQKSNKLPWMILKDFQKDWLIFDVDCPVNNGHIRPKHG